MSMETAKTRHRGRLKKPGGLVLEKTWEFWRLREDAQDKDEEIENQRQPAGLPTNTERYAVPYQNQLLRKQSDQEIISH